MWWLTFGTVLFLGVLAAWMPRMWRADLPLGVNVPSDHVHDPVIAQSVHRYRLWVGGLTAALLALVAGVGSLAPDARAMTVLILGTTFVMVFGIAALMRLASQPIRDAKQRESWYAGKQVAVIASVSGAPDPAARPRWWWHALALLVLLGCAAYAVQGYAGFPDPLPAHIGPDGVDRWEPKTWWSVLQPLAIGLAVVLGVAAMAWSIGRQAPRILPGGDPAAAAADHSRRAAATQQLVGLSNVICAITLAASAVMMWNGSTTHAPALLAFGLAAPIAVLVGTVVVIGRRGPAPRVGAGPESPDQDRYWKWGIAYVNPEDPRLMVDKRTGLGLTFNFGHPVGKLIGVLLLLLLLVTALAPALGSLFGR